MRLAWAFLVALCLASAARSEVARVADVEFNATLADWLAGNEADSLPKLAALAKNGHLSARLLLAQIDRFPALQGDWLAQLSRADRIAVLRQQGGVSGVNWMTADGMQTQPIAKAWAQLWDGGATPQVILDFARLGETRAARFAGLTLARRQKTGFANIADDPDYPASLLAYAVREGWKAPKGTVDPADPQSAILGQKPDVAGFSDWAALAPEADAIVALCEVVCPAESAAICRPAALQALGGYWGLMPLGSPIESVVASDVFNRSAKGIDTTLRHMQGPVQSACLTEALK